MGLKVRPIWRASEPRPAEPAKLGHNRTKVSGLSVVLPQGDDVDALSRSCIVGRLQDHWRHRGGLVEAFRSPVEPG